LEGVGCEMARIEIRKTIFAGGSKRHVPERAAS